MNSLTPSFKLLADYLQENGYIVSALDLGVSDSFVSIKSVKSDKSLVINAKSPTYPFPTASGRRIYLDKELAYAYARNLGLSTPEGITVTTYEDERLVEFLNTNQRLIVKPQNGHGSQGLSLNVTDVDSLKAAIRTAREYSDAVLVQRQFIGEEIRFTIIDGVAKSALLREKPHVIGDGISTVEQLIAFENQARQKITNTAVSYPSLDEKLISHDMLTSKHIPAKDTRVELGLGTMIRTGASMYDVLNVIDPTYVAIAEKLGSSFGKGFLAIDMMIADISLPARPDSYIFLEINSDPALVLYYSCRDGHHVDVVRKYLGPKIIKAIEGNAR